MTSYYREFPFGEVYGDRRMDRHSILLVLPLHRPSGLVLPLFLVPILLLAFWPPFSII